MIFAKNLLPNWALRDSTKHLLFKQYMFVLLFDLGMTSEVGVLMLAETTDIFSCFVDTQENNCFCCVMR